MWAQSSSLRQRPLMLAGHTVCLSPPVSRSMWIAESGLIPGCLGRLDLPARFDRRQTGWSLDGHHPRYVAWREASLPGLRSEVIEPGQRRLAIADVAVCSAVAGAARTAAPTRN